MGAQRIALRIRKVDGSVLLTLKADDELHDDVSDRFELEAPLSRDVLQAAQRELTQHGIELGKGDGSVAEDPQGMPSGLGLTPIQRRATQRTRRAVQTTDGTVLAELALDVVRYIDPLVELRLYEVEIERRSPTADVRALADSLVAAFPSLSPWRYGKLSTGLGAVAAAAAGRLDLGEDGTLTPAAFEQLERELEQGV
jgi:inorganic triphosphatase YgiF